MLDLPPEVSRIPWSLYYEELLPNKYILKGAEHARRIRSNHDKLVGKMKKIRVRFLKEGEVYKPSRHISIRQLGIGKAVIVNRPNKKAVSLGW